MEVMECPAQQGWWSLQEGKEGELATQRPTGGRAQVSAPPADSQERKWVPQSDWARGGIPQAGSASRPSSPFPPTNLRATCPLALPHQQSPNKPPAWKPTSALPHASFTFQVSHSREQSHLPPTQNDPST